MQTTKLRIGLLIDSWSTEAWAFRMVEDIQRSAYGEVCLVVMPDAASPVAQRNPATQNWLKRNYRNIATTLVRRFLEQVYIDFIERHTRHAGPQEALDLQSLVPSVPVLKVSPIQTRWSDSFSDSDLAAIRSHAPDVFIRLGFRILRGGILGAARFGVWSYHHADNTVNRGGPPGFWEFMQNWPETGSTLQILTEDLDNGKVLYRSFSCTNSFSLSGNKGAYYWKSLSFIPRKLDELHRLGAERFFANIEAQNADPMLYSRRLYKTPTNREYARLLAKKLAEKSLHIIRNKLYFEQWILLFDLRESLSTSLWRYRRMVPPKDRFWADPHAVERDGKYYVFIEEFIYAKRKGHISVIEIRADGTYSKPVPVIDQPYHLSYPFVFEYRGSMYLIPESASNRTIELYKCEKFPFKWVREKTLINDIEAYDATLFDHNGRWWLFANVVNVAGASSWDELFIFHADSPLSDSWHPHRANPVISDCKSSRPAGPIFSLNGRYYRPSQNSSVRYGRGFNLARIETLDEDAYRETIVTRVEPDWAPDLVATHSFSRAGNLHMIDAQIRRRR